MDEIEVLGEKEKHPSGSGIKSQTRKERMSHESCESVDGSINSRFRQQHCGYGGSNLSLCEVSFAYRVRFYWRIGTALAKLDRTQLIGSILDSVLRGKAEQK